jgi:hypothetical protein
MYARYADVQNMPTTERALGQPENVEASLSKADVQREVHYAPSAKWARTKRDWKQFRFRSRSQDCRSR